jgi:diguanylate cyclase (GGDEF)-like protein
MFLYPSSVPKPQGNSNVEVRFLFFTLIIIFVINTPLRYLKTDKLEGLAFELGLIKDAIEVRNQTVANILQLSTHEIVRNYFNNPEPFLDLKAKLLKKNDFITKITIKKIRGNLLSCDASHASSYTMQTLFKPEEQRFVIYQPICTNMIIRGYLYLEVDLRALTHFTQNGLVLASKTGLIYVSSDKQLHPAASMDSIYPKLWRELEVVHKTKGTLEYPNVTVIYQKLTFFTDKPVYIIKTLQGGDLIPLYFYLIITLLALTVAISLYLRKVRKEKAALRQISFTDQLSGLYNRHYLKHITAKVEKHGQYYVVIFDIDHFKAINDSYGHDIGDQVIKRVASVIKSRSRLLDYAFRIGGEEFLMLLKTDSKEFAINTAERIRHDIETLAQKPNITISGGICHLSHSLSDTIKCADTHLYQAKKEGRNIVVC